MNKPLVSIIIPCFNRENYLPETIESCLEQTHSNLEIIVADDGSTDGSVTVAKQYAQQDDRVKVFHTVNQGPCVARNNGLGLSQGIYVKFLDSDDVLLPYSIEYQVDSLEHYQVDLTSGKILGFFDGGLPQAKQEVPSSLSFTEEDKPLNEPYLNLIQKIPLTFNEVLLKREIAYQSGGFHPWLGGANESSLNARILCNFPHAKATFHQDTVVLLKRLGDYSLAATNRQSKETLPWALISYQKSGEYALKRSDKLTPEVKHFIFDRLYKLAIYAYRQNKKGYALTALEVWQKANVQPPLLAPWYHNMLHHYGGFIQAEETLERMRRLASPFRST